MNESKANSVCAPPTETRLSAVTFFAKAHPGDVCGSNGLPLTPNSIAILGRAQRLKELRHPNLCLYLDIIRGKHERIIVVSEHSGYTLEQYLKDHAPLQLTQIISIFKQLARGLQALHEHKLVAHSLEPKHVVIDETGQVKLYNYGLYHMTRAGEYISFPIGNAHYVPPERLFGAHNNIKSDVWALGMIVAELALQTTFWRKLKLADLLRQVLALCSCENVLEELARQHDCLRQYEAMNSDLRDALNACLAVSPARRTLPAQLLLWELFTEQTKNSESVPAVPAAAPLLLRCPLEHIYYLWQLAGGDVQAELNKWGLIRSEAPILALPQLVYLHGAIYGPKRSQAHLMDERVVLLRLNVVMERLRQVPALAYFPLLHSPKFPYAFGRGMEKLPLVIREKDVEYQMHRVRLFARLLIGQPHAEQQLRREAAIDIPPMLRGPVWAALLNALPNGSYAKIDKFSPTSTDRQIEVDIPRCHQYDELLSSPDGHRKLKRLLKAWVTAHPHYVYWQGLDSLTAPFLYLNFNNEELAFLCMYNFIPKYLQWFFLKDNSPIIKEYLCKFSQLIAYHEPMLATHLERINFIPELFAIPWFLTMFSHVFPLHKILHLWDKLILGDSSYPLYIGIAILKQIKSTLLSSGFNECILLFSDLPDIAMETCVIDSQLMYDATPKSISHRKHARQLTPPGAFDISNDVTCEILQAEMCSRISANDYVHLLRNQPDTVILLDLRNANEYARIRVANSLNVAFNVAQLDKPSRLDALGIPKLDSVLQNRIVVCVSHVLDHCIKLSSFLVKCGIARVCVLHGGFNILHSVEPNILLTS